MEHDSNYYDRKWNQIIAHMPVGGEYRFDLRKPGYMLAIDEIPQGSKVFDYACGLSVLSGLLKEKDCKVSGCDFSPVAVDYCNKKYGGNFKVTDEIFGGPYDFVIAAYFLEHIKDPVGWVKHALSNAPKVICHLPRNFRKTGEHIDMAWGNWPEFYEMFKDFNPKRLDTKIGAPEDTMSDEWIKYPKIGQFAHPIVMFTGKKGKRKKKRMDDEGKHSSN